jgi:predicted outer membrane protein
MRMTLTALCVAGVLALPCAQAANAVPVDPAALATASDAASPLQQAQFSERPTHRGVVKCYREFVIGPYRCHYFRNPLFYF